MAERGDARERDPVLRIVLGGNEAFRKHDVGGFDVQLAGGDAGEPAGDALAASFAVPATAAAKRLA